MVAAKSDRLLGSGSAWRVFHLPVKVNHIIKRMKIERAAMIFRYYNLTTHHVSTEPRSH